MSFQEKKQRTAEDASDSKEDIKEERVITLRPLNMDDFREAKNQVNEPGSFFFFSGVNFYIFFCELTVLDVYKYLFLGMLDL